MSEVLTANLTIPVHNASKPYPKKESRQVPGKSQHKLLFKRILDSQIRYICYQLMYIIYNK